MTETRRTKIHACLRGTDQMLSARRIRQEAHHQVLQQPLRVLDLDEDPLGSIGRLLQEHRVPRDLRNVDRNRIALAGENGVHHRYVLVGQVAADGEDQDPRREEHRGVFRMCARGIGVAGRNHGVGEDGLLVDVGEREGQGARDGGCGRERFGLGFVHELLKGGGDGLLDLVEGTVFVRVCAWGGCARAIGGVHHLDVSAGVILCGGAVLLRYCSWRNRVEVDGTLAVACYDGDLVGVIEGQVCVDEDAEVSDGGREWQAVV